MFFILTIVLIALSSQQIVQGNDGTRLVHQLMNRPSFKEPSNSQPIYRSGESKLKRRETEPVLDPGEPLFLTDYIKNKKSELGREKSRVVGLATPDVESYSGFITVNETHNSNIFFWFLPAETNKETAPLMIWMDGGPGQTDLYSSFVYNGPYKLDQEMNVLRRNESWTKIFNVLFVDSPVGTGFSFTDENGFPDHESQVVDHLYSFIQQFFQIFPEYKTNDFHVGGISYAGMLLLSGLVDVVAMSRFSEQYYQFGIISKQTSQSMAAGEKLAEKIYEDGKEMQALLINGLVGQIGKEESGYESMSLLEVLEDNSNQNFIPFVNSTAHRASFHVGNAKYHVFIQDTNFMREKLGADISKSAKPLVEEVLRNDYPVLFMAGQMDATLPVAKASEFVDSLEWQGQENYLSKSRYKFFADEELAGYVQSVPKLAFAIVKNAGHVIPKDYPAFSFAILESYYRDLAGKSGRSN